MDCSQGRNRQAIDGSGQTARRKHETGNQRRYAPVYHKEADRSLPQFRLKKWKREMSDRQKKNRARKPVYDFRALSFCGCCCGKCYAIERHFRGKRYKVSPIRFSRPESLANQGIFRAYCVTGARLFLMRSAACLRVIRFRQSGQYLTLLELDAKDVPHSVHFFLSPVGKAPHRAAYQREAPQP